MSAQGVVMHCTGSDSIKVTTQLKTSENSWEHRKTSITIWYHPENNWGPIIDNLVQFEEDFNSRTKKLRWSRWLSQTRPIPRSPDGDKKWETELKLETLGYAHLLVWIRVLEFSIFEEIVLLLQPWILWIFGFFPNIRWRMFGLFKISALFTFGSYQTKALLYQYASGVENDNIQEGLIDLQGSCRHGDTCELAERQTRRLHCTAAWTRGERGGL